MKRSEWIGHSTARRKLTEHGWLYEDANIQEFVIRGLLHGINLAEIDGFIEQLEAEGAGAGAELREHRQLAWEGRNDEQIFFRRMEWIFLRRNAILREKALLDEVKRLKREAIGESLPVSPPKKATNKWTGPALRQLLDESREPGMTHQELAKKYAVSRQRIAALLKKAAPKKATPFAPLNQKRK